jgi:hypothetical protein
MSITTETKNEILEIGKDELILSPIQNDRFFEANEKLEKKLEEFQIFWNERLQKLFPLLKNFQNLQRVEISYLSYRHQMNDILFSSFVKISKLKQSYDAIHTKMMNNQELSKKYKLQKDKRAYIDQKLSGLKRRIEILEDFVKYCQSIIDTIDKLSFSVKNRITFESMK